MTPNIQRPLNAVVSRRARENAERAAAQKIFTREAKASLGSNNDKLLALWLKQQGETDGENAEA
jgi:hypothetical protein